LNLDILVSRLKMIRDLGYKLFRDDPSSLPVTFVPGDIYNDEFLSADGPPSPTSKAGESITYPSLGSLDLKDSLNPLKGKISAIHASSFFHLFSEEQQATIAHKLAALLSPEPGSVIFGSHAGAEVKMIRKGEVRGQKFEVFCHSTESFKELWEKAVFKDGGIVVEAIDVPIDADGNCLNFWNVRRV